MNISSGHSTRYAFNAVVYHIALAALGVIGVGAIALISGVASVANQTSSDMRINPSSAGQFVAPADVVNVVLVSSAEEKARIEESIDRDANHIAELGIIVPKPAIVLVKGTPIAEELLNARWANSLPPMSIVDLTLP